MTSLRKNTRETAAERLQSVMLQLNRRLRLLSGSHQLTWSQLAVLARLEALGPATTAALARIEAVRPQSMGATLASLEELGLVLRAPDPADGRQVIFELTGAGRQLRAEAAAAKRAWLASAIAGLEGAEQRTLLDAIAILEKLGTQ
ncbi:MAG: MarR family transcriptional regulator [Variovorax sp.]|nr:MAG: MarR family transcriptional regulator [Variovorax sp.]